MPIHFALKNLKIQRNEFAMSNDFVLTKTLQIQSKEYRNANFISKN